MARLTRSSPAVRLATSLDFVVVVAVVQILASWSSPHRRAALLVEGGSPLPSWAVKIAMDQGPNVCVVEEVPGTSKRMWTECRFYSHRRVCGQKTVLRYECCDGFEQMRGQKGCMKVKPLRDLLSTLEQVGAGKFAEYLRRSDLGDLFLAGREPYTLFAPSDDAFLEQEFGQGSLGPPVHKYHVVRDRVGMDAELMPSSKTAGGGGPILLDTLLAGRTVRLDKHSSGILTVDCVPIVRKNVQAANGVIHVIDGVLDPTKSRGIPAATALALDSRFTQFARWLQETGLADELDRRGDAVTILAPTDEAFGKQPRSRWDAIYNDTVARRALVENHVVPGAVLCPAAVTEADGAGNKLPTLLAGGRVAVSCDQGGVTVGGGRATDGEYVVADNGLVLTVEDVLVPTRAMNVVQLAESSGNLSIWLELAAAAGLKNTMETDGDYTYFAPTDEAFQAVDQREMAELRANPSRARDLVMFHGMKGIYRKNEMVGDKAVLSLDEENELRIQTHRDNRFSVETAVLVPNRRGAGEMRGRNGVIHPIDAVLRVPTLSAGDYLRKDGRFKTFLRMMDVALARNPLLLESSVSGSKGSSTFFVPTDEAFAKVRSRKMIAALDAAEPEFAEELVRSHILPSLVCSRVMEPGLTYGLQSLLQTHLGSADSEGRMTIGKAEVIEKDISTTNGIVHVINRVLAIGPANRVGAGGQSRTQQKTWKSSAAASQSHHSIDIAGRGSEAGKANTADNNGRRHSDVDGGSSSLKSLGIHQQHQEHGRSSAAGQQSRIESAATEEEGGEGRGGGGSGSSSWSSWSSTRIRHGGGSGSGPVSTTTTKITRFRNESTSSHSAVVRGGAGGGASSSSAADLSSGILDLIGPVGGGTSSSSSSYSSSFKRQRNHNSGSGRWSTGSDGFSAGDSDNLGGGIQQVSALSETARGSSDGRGRLGILQIHRHRGGAGGEAARHALLGEGISGLHGEDSADSHVGRGDISPAED